MLPTRLPPVHGERVKLVSPEVDTFFGHQGTLTVFWIKYLQHAALHVPQFVPKYSVTNQRKTALRGSRNILSDWNNVAGAAHRS